jgi:hypothetical protein
MGTNETGLPVFSRFFNEKKYPISSPHPKIIGREQSQTATKGSYSEGTSPDATNAFASPQTTWQGRLRRALLLEPGLDATDHFTAAKLIGREHTTSEVAGVSPASLLAKKYPTSITAPKPLRAGTKCDREYIPKMYPITSPCPNK